MVFLIHFSKTQYVFQLFLHLQLIIPPYSLQAVDRRPKSLIPKSLLKSYLNMIEHISMELCVSIKSYNVDTCTFKLLPIEYSTFDNIFSMIKLLLYIYVSIFIYIFSRLRILFLIELYFSCNYRISDTSLNQLVYTHQLL